MIEEEKVITVGINVETEEDGFIIKKPFGLDTFVFIVIFGVIAGACSHVMGLGNFINTLMNSGQYLIINLVIWMMALGGVMGAISALLSEFGVIALVNKLISPLMRPLYGLPGAASIGALSTFLSDSPSIISCAQDKNFIKYFKPYQKPLLCNFGMAYGMGLIVISFFIAQGVENGVVGAFVGLLGAVVGSVVSVRLMARSTSKYFNVSKEEFKADHSIKNDYIEQPRKVSKSTFDRVIMTMLSGAKSGLQLGKDIFPCILTIALIVLMLVWGPGENGYDGSACQGLALLPKIGDIISPVTKLLFGFEDGIAVVFPLTAIGTCGAALGLVPAIEEAGALTANNIAVFAAMGMCWSGYMSNCAGMMEALEERRFIKPCIVSHTIGGLVAGIFAHLVMMLIF